MKQPKSKSDANEDLDDTDASVDYKNFQNDTLNLPGEDQETEDLEFVNPLFKQQPRLFNSTVDNINDVEEDYDKLSFRNSTTTLPKDSPKQPSRQKTEEIEMGVKNYGYMNENPRPDSWDSSLSAFNPYAVDTPIRQPVNGQQVRNPSVGLEMSESPPGNRQNSISKKSDYSSISDVNPYMMPTEKGPQYEDLAGLRAGHANRTNGRPVPAGSKKANMIYEPAVISKTKSYQKRTSIDEEGSYADNSNYCHLLFTILIGVLAIVALLIVFLVIFGVVSAKKCKECEVTSVTATAGESTGGFSTDLDLQLSYIKGNLTLLQNVLHANSSITIATLQSELDGQKALVASLTTQLNQQKILTASLNEHTRSLQTKVDNINTSVILKTQELHVRIERTETAAGQGLSDVQKSIENTKTEIIESMRNKTDYIEGIIETKVASSNYTRLKEEATEMHKNLTKVAATNAMWSHLLNTNIITLKGLLNNTITNVAQLNTYTGRLQQNLTVVRNELNNITSSNKKHGCSYDFMKETNQNAATDTKAKSSIPKGVATDSIASASCSSNAISTILIQDGNTKRFHCECTGVYKDFTTQYCIINYWVCP